MRVRKLEGQKNRIRKEMVSFLASKFKKSAGEVKAAMRFRGGAWLSSEADFVRIAGQQIRHAVIRLAIPDASSPFSTECDIIFLYQKFPGLKQQVEPLVDEFMEKHREIFAEAIIRGWK